MKSTRITSHLTLLATLIAAATLSAACSSTAVKLSESTSNTAPEHSPVMAMESPAFISATMIESMPESSVEATADPAQTTTMTLDPTASIDNADDTAPMDTSRPARLTFNFDFNKEKLSPDHQRIVEEHGRFLAEHPEIKLVINGHTDAQGDTRYNQALSLKRAEHVADLLMSQGAMKEQIEIFSWGSTAPLADANKNRDQRRVELKYTDEYWVQSTVE